MPRKNNLNGFCSSLQKLFVLLIVMTSSGCAQLIDKFLDKLISTEPFLEFTRDQCLEANSTSWETIGRDEGRQGFTASQRLAVHKKACGRYGLVPDQDSYMKGWSLAVQQRCSTEGAFAIGARDFYVGTEEFYGGGSKWELLFGQYPGNLCPENLRESFDCNYKLGREAFDIKTKIKSASDAYDAYLNASYEVERERSKPHNVYTRREWPSCHGCISDQEFRELRKQLAVARTRRCTPPSSAPTPP